LRRSWNNNGTINVHSFVRILDGKHGEWSFWYLLLIYFLLEHARQDHPAARGLADPCRNLQGDRKRRAPIPQIAYYPIKRPVCRAPIVANKLQQVWSRPCSVSIATPDIGILNGFLASSQASVCSLGAWDTWKSSPGPVITFPVPPYCSDPGDVIFDVVEGGIATLCRSRRGIAGDIQLTFCRSFSYLHYKSLSRYSRPLALGGERYRDS
jgi:hypothetical protein